MIFDTSNSLSVERVTGGSTGHALRCEERRRACRLAPASVAAADEVEVLEGFLDRDVDPGAEARKAASHRLGDSCEDDWIVADVCGLSWGAVCIWTSVSGLASPSTFAHAVEVERLRRDLSTGPPAPCSGTIFNS